LKKIDELVLKDNSYQIEYKINKKDGKPIRLIGYITERKDENCIKE